jgi:hypothetical protein
VQYREELMRRLQAAIAAQPAQECEHQWRTGGAFVDCVLCGVESPVWRPGPPEPLCDCDTKTPELRFHSANCAYRVYSERAAAQPSQRVAWRDVQTERERQVSAEGWTPEHDDEHRGELQMAAACLCVDATGAEVRLDDEQIDVWGLAAKHHGKWRRQLVIAGALILAAIEKMDRAAAPRVAPVAQPERARAVPREPTDAMIRAGFDAEYKHRVSGDWTRARERWFAMYDAAPIATLPDGDTR